MEQRSSAGPLPLLPGILPILLFAAGALGGYTLIALIAGLKPEPRMPTRAPSGRLMFGMLHWFAVGISIAAV